MYTNTNIWPLLATCESPYVTLFPKGISGITARNKNGENYDAFKLLNIANTMSFLKTCKKTRSER